MFMWISLQRLCIRLDRGVLVAGATLLFVCVVLEIQAVQRCKVCNKSWEVSSSHLALDHCLHYHRQSQSSDGVILRTLKFLQ